MSGLALKPTQPPIQWVPGFFPRGEVAGPSVNLPPCSAKVQNDWSSLPLLCLRAMNKENVMFFTVLYCIWNKTQRLKIILDLKASINQNYRYFHETHSFRCEISPTRCNNCVLFFAMALLYMFRATISPIIRSTYAVYGHR